MQYSRKPSSQGDRIRLSAVSLAYLQVRWGFIFWRSMTNVISFYNTQPLLAVQSFLNLFDRCIEGEDDYSDFISAPILFRIQCLVNEESLFECCKCFLLAVLAAVYPTRHDQRVSYCSIMLPSLHTPLDLADVFLVILLFFIVRQLQTMMDTGHGVYNVYRHVFGFRVQVLMLSELLNSQLAILKCYLVITNQHTTCSEYKQADATMTSVLIQLRMSFQIGEHRLERSIGVPFGRKAQIGQSGIRQDGLNMPLLRDCPNFSLNYHFQTLLFLYGRGDLFRLHSQLTQLLISGFKLGFYFLNILSRFIFPLLLLAFYFLKELLNLFGLSQLVLFIIVLFLALHFFGLGVQRVSLFDSVVGCCPSATGNRLLYGFIAGVACQGLYLLTFPCRHVKSLVKVSCLSLLLYHVLQFVHLGRHLMLLHCIFGKTEFSNSLLHLRVATEASLPFQQEGKPPGP